MSQNLAYVSAAILFLIACDSQSQGIASLGTDFVRAFQQERNAEPFDASELTLTLTPTREPFNP